MLHRGFVLGRVEDSWVSSAMSNLNFMLLDANMRWVFLFRRAKVLLRSSFPSIATRLSVLALRILLNYFRANAGAAETLRFIEQVESLASAAPVSLIATRFDHRSIIDRRSW
jgi:hypothetical protein